MRRYASRLLSLILIFTMLAAMFPVMGNLGDVYGDELQTWDPQMEYEARFAVLTKTKEGYDSLVETQPVRVIDNCLMVDLLWLAKRLKFTATKEEFPDGLPSNSLWLKTGAVDQSDAVQSRAAFTIRKEEESMLQILLCTDVLEAAVCSPYTGAVRVPLGAAIFEEKKEDGRLCYWAPLDDILFLVDSYALNQDGVIQIYPCQTTVQDILNHKKLLNELYCDVLEESGVGPGMLGLSAWYNKFYDQLQKLFNGVVNLDATQIKKAFSGYTHENAGETLALQFCSASDREYRALEERSQFTLAAYSSESAMIQEITQKIQTGLQEQGKQMMQELEAFFQELCKMSRSETTDLLFQRYDNGLRRANEILEKAEWWGKVGEVQKKGFLGLDIIGSAWIQYSMLSYELDTANSQYAENVGMFLEHYDKENGIIMPGIIKGMEKKVEFYQQDGQVNLGTTAGKEAIQEYFISSILSKGLDAAVNSAASGVLAPYQLTATGWTMAEIAVNQASNGAFDALDCLELSLYGMQMETEMYKTLVDYKDTMRFEGEFLSPQFDHEKMETFACLAWNYLKACYITRENMLGIYQTQKNDEHYEIAVQGILEYQDKTAELLDVLNARIDGVTQERAKQQEEVRQVENRYLLKAVQSIYNNGGNYVKKDNAVYFWKYREDSFEKIAKFGIFGKLAGEGNQLIKRAEDGTETVIYQGSGYDKIFIHNGRFYLTGSEPSSYGFYMSNVYSIDMDGKDRKDYGPGKILDLDEENGVLICMSVDYKDSLYLIYCEDGSRTELCEYAEYLGREGQYAYYENKAENNNLLIERVALDGSQTETVLELSGYAQQYGLEEGASIIASQIYNGYLYFNYGYIAGTARLYQEGVIGRVRLDGSGYQVIAGTGVRKNETFYVYANDSGEVFINIRDLYGGNYRIALKDLSITSVETISATMGEIFCEGGAAYFYPEANNVLVQIVKDDRLDNASGMGETYFQVRDAQIVDGYIYYITEYSVHNPEGDMGWRYSYERKETTLYRRPLNGDQIEVIYQY